MALLGHQGTGDIAHGKKHFYEGPRGQKTHTHGKKHFFEGPRGRRHTGVA